MMKLLTQVVDKMESIDIQRKYFDKLTTPFKTIPPEMATISCIMLYYSKMVVTVACVCMDGEIDK